MKLMKYVRRLLKKENAGQRFEYVREESDEDVIERIQPETALSVQETLPPPVEPHPEDDIAFSPQGDLEAYVRGLAVSKEAIERWISAGVLLPEETKVATKMIRIMCRPNKDRIQ